MGARVWEDGWIKEKLMRSPLAKTSNNGHVNYGAAQGNELPRYSASANISDEFFYGSEFHYVHYNTLRARALCFNVALFCLQFTSCPVRPFEFARFSTKFSHSLSLFPPPFIAQTLLR